MTGGATARDLATTLSLAAPSAAGAQTQGHHRKVTVIADHLNNPRGLAPAPGGGLYLAGAGEHVADIDLMAVDARARYARDPVRYERGMTKLLRARSWTRGGSRDAEPMGGIAPGRFRGAGPRGGRATGEAILKLFPDVAYVARVQRRLFRCHSGLSSLRRSAGRPRGLPRGPAGS